MDTEQASEHQRRQPGTMRSASAGTGPPAGAIASLVLLVAAVGTPPVLAGRCTSSGTAALADGKTIWDAVAGLVRGRGGEGGCTVHVRRDRLLEHV